MTPGKEAKAMQLIQILLDDIDMAIEANGESWATIFPLQATSQDLLSLIHRAFPEKSIIDFLFLLMKISPEEQLIKQFAIQYVDEYSTRDARTWIDMYIKAGVKTQKAWEKECSLIASIELTTQPSKELL